MTPRATSHAYAGSQTTLSPSLSEVTCVAQDDPDCQQRWAQVPLVGEYEDKWPITELTGCLYWTVHRAWEVLTFF